MDSLITAAARALAACDPLDALRRVPLRDDAPALALRGIAMAQLGDLVRAKALLRRAGRPSKALLRSLRLLAKAASASPMRLPLPMGPCSVIVDPKRLGHCPQSCVRRPQFQGPDQ
jgi:hypothetical protein